MEKEEKRLRAVEEEARLQQDELRRLERKLEEDLRREEATVPPQTMSTGPTSPTGDGKPSKPPTGSASATAGASNQPAQMANVSNASGVGSRPQPSGGAVHPP